MLALEDCRRVFADRLAQCASANQSFERALMAACEYAYRRGLADGQANTPTAPKPGEGS